MIGEEAIYRYELCQSCGGTGFINRYDTKSSTSCYTLVTCPACAGTGRQNSVDEIQEDSLLDFII